MRGTSSSVSSDNPLLSAGQPFYETNTHKLKIGDGSTYYNSLPYIGEDESSGLDVTISSSDGSSSRNTYYSGCVQLNETTRLTFGNISVKIDWGDGSESVIGEGADGQVGILGKSTSVPYSEFPDTYPYIQFAALFNNYQSQAGVSVDPVYWSKGPNSNVYFGLWGHAKGSPTNLGYMIVSTSKPTD